MARAPPSAPSIPSRKRFTFSRRPRPSDPPLRLRRRSERPRPLAGLDYRQMPEFTQGHHLHDGGDGVGLPATDDLARHHRADWFVQHRGTPLTERAHDIALRQDAFDAAFAHRQHSADLALRQNLDRCRKLRARLDALNLMAFGIENCAYRHGRLPKWLSP